MKNYLSLILPFSSDKTDVTTLHNLLKTFKRLEMKTLHYVMDKCFYSWKSVSELVQSRDKFILAVPIKIKWVQHAIDDIGKMIHGPEEYRKIDGETLYVHSRLYPWGKRRCYLHLYYNAHIKAQAVDQFNKELLEYKEELDSGNLIEENQEAYDRFLSSRLPLKGEQRSPTKPKRYTNT